MPLYTFKCLICNKDFDEFTQDYAKTRAECPHCGNTRAMKSSVYEVKARTMTGRKDSRY